MQIKAPSLFDDDVFIPHDVGDVQPEMQVEPLQLSDLNPIFLLAAPHQLPVGEMTLNQPDINSQMTMQYEVYHQTESQLFLMQQSNTEVPQSAGKYIESLFVGSDRCSSLMMNLLKLHQATAVEYRTAMMTYCLGSSI
jgi:hypothetical protein